MATAGRNRNGYETRADNGVALLSSLVFHVALLLILACWMYTAGKPSQGLLLSAEIGESIDTSFDLVQTFEQSPEVEQTQPEISAPEVELSVELKNLIEVPNEREEHLLSAALASLSSNDIADGLKQNGSGRGANFFGAYAEGNRFVYVLDSSRSMKGDRWLYACNQLLDSLHGLKEGQEFFVLCFDMQTSFLFNTLPERAAYFTVDASMVEKVKRWLRSRTLGRATMPADALRYAIDFNPDAIFLLSDGELQDNSVKMLRLINGISSERRQIPIHTVHLFSRQGRLTLQMIAMENGGSFTPITDHRK